MIYKEEKRNLFDINEKYYLAHCISSDCKMGAGIAVEFQKRFNLRNALSKYNTNYPICIQIGKVFNLITKDKYWHKPTYVSLTSTLFDMKNLAVDNNVKFIAMPKIGCGLDRLAWGKVREIIQDIFKDTDIEIIVCHL